MVDIRRKPFTRPDRHASLSLQPGAARKASVEVVTSAKVTSITHREVELASDSSSADRDHSAMAQEPEHAHVRFELEFTTETPLPPAMRNALGVTTAASTAEATDGVVADEGMSAKRNGGAGVGGSRSGRGSYRIPCDYVLQATGAAREGHGWARTLGHAVSAPVPSLFTLTIRDPR